MNKQAQAWKDWLASHEGQNCADGTSAGSYLENRLWRAFMAGYSVAKEPLSGLSLSRPRSISIAVGLLVETVDHLDDGFPGVDG